jgi:hypothetical protein
MKATFDIPDPIMEETTMHSNAATEQEAVLIALEDYNRRHRTAKLMRIFGTFKSISSNWEIEALEKREVR